MEYFTFNDGQKYPVIALGTVRLQGAVGIQKIHSFRSQVARLLTRQQTTTTKVC